MLIYNNSVEIKKFLYKWKNNNFGKQILYDYKKICSKILYENEELLLETSTLLKNNIINWAKNYSKVDFDKAYISKQDLIKKEDWYVENILHESDNMRTSGTTSNRFSYLRWRPFLYFIEAENHYDLILNEFKLPSKIKMLYFFNINGNYKRLDFNNKAVVLESFYNFLEKHGTTREVETYYVNFELLKKDPGHFFDDFFKFLDKESIDVLFISGPDVNLLNHFIVKNNFKNKLCKLLSNSYEKVLKKDLDYLLNNNYIDSYCDHMRCWDGGATFFTCSYRNYHLMDNISWCEEKEGKLVSTDYFSLPSPFLNYWNGDLCEIKNEYSRCECGRLFRPFKFIENRPFLLKGYSINEIIKIIKENNFKISQVRCSLENPTNVDIICLDEISEDLKNKLMNKFENLNFKFYLVN